MLTRVRKAKPPRYWLDVLLLGAASAAASVATGRRLGLLWPDVSNRGEGDPTLAFALVSLGCLTAWLLLRVPQWQTRHLPNSPEPNKKFEAENQARGTLATILGGAALLASLYNTAGQLKEQRSQARETSELTRLGQMNDRYIKAVELLGSIDKAPMASKLGAIYSLGQVARLSPSDHEPIMELLLFYVRERARARKEGDKPTDDLQAAITVIGSRNLKNDGASILSFDFQGLDLSSLKFDKLHFDYSDFRGADLRGTKITRSYLCGANFERAKTEASEFRDSDLRLALLANPAWIVDSRLDGAWIDVTDQENVHFVSGSLRGTALSEAIPSDKLGDFTGAHVFPQGASNALYRSWQEDVLKMLGAKGAFPDGCSKARAAVARYLVTPPGAK